MTNEGSSAKIDCSCFILRAGKIELYEWHAPRSKAQEEESWDDLLRAAGWIERRRIGNGVGSEEIALWCADHVDGAPAPFLVELCIGDAIKWIFAETLDDALGLWTRLAPTVYLQLIVTQLDALDIAVRRLCQATQGHDSFGS